jgi:hypothetical protein
MGTFIKTTFLVHKPQLSSVIKKINFRGEIGFFMFLGFFEKNLKSKKCVFGVKNEKKEKSKYVF